MLTRGVDIQQALIIQTGLPKWGVWKQELHSSPWQQGFWHFPPASLQVCYLDMQPAVGLKCDFQPEGVNVLAQNWKCGILKVELTLKPIP